MNRGGRYLREKKGAKARRVAWTRTREEAAAEKRAAEAKKGKGSGGAESSGGEAER